MLDVVPGSVLLVSGTGPPFLFTPLGLATGDKPASGEVNSLSRTKMLRPRDIAALGDPAIDGSAVLVAMLGASFGLPVARLPRDAVFAGSNAASVGLVVPGRPSMVLLLPSAPEALCPTDSNDSSPPAVGRSPTPVNLFLVVVGTDTRLAGGAIGPGEDFLFFHVPVVFGGEAPVTGKPPYIVRGRVRWL